MRRMNMAEGEAGMLVSTKGRYALRVMIDLTEHPADGFVPLKEIAQRQEISEKYLESIIKLLVKAGLLQGLRGKGGGYRMAIAPERLTVGRVLKLTEGSLSPVACLEENASPCLRSPDCRTLPLWQGLEKVIDEYLGSVTIADLAKADEPGNDYVI